jgi:hypothetical protein
LHRHSVSDTLGAVPQAPLNAISIPPINLPAHSPDKKLLLHSISSGPSGVSNSRGLLAITALDLSSIERHNSN